MRFLKLKAQEILNEHPRDLERIAVVFPNKRTSLFFNEELAELKTDDTPWFAPRYYTITELFLSEAQCPVADKIHAVMTLYKVYCQFMHTSETIDQFWSWGEVMLDDFDDLDKQLANAKTVFANIEAWHHYDDMSGYLTDEQRQALKAFFRDLTAVDDDSIRGKFKHLWEQLFNIYSEFNRVMLEEHGAYGYEGAMLRAVATKGAEELSHFADLERIYFVGFNHLTKVEQRLIKLLGDKAVEKKYELEEPTDGNLTYISAATENIQARYVKQWLLEDDSKRLKAGKRTAIVLGDESLLRSVVNYLPESEGVNITLGYPLNQTPIAAEVKRLMLNIVYRKRFGVAGDENVKTLPDLLEYVRARGIKSDDSFERAGIAKMFMIIQSLLDMGVDGQLNARTQMRLIDQIVARQTIPYKGEPLSGVQVMGLLETRNLDFDHVLVLSANEGNMPRGVNEPSLIPFIIRLGLGLTTVNKKVEMYSTYFKQLLGNLNDVTLTYNCSTDDTGVKQMSRFMMQLMVRLKTKIQFKTLTTNDIETREVETGEIIKTGEVWDEMLNLLNHRHLSPSAISNYLRCPKKFYYANVRQLKEPESPSLNDSRMYGKALHTTAEKIYNGAYFKLGETITAEKLDKLINSPETILQIIENEGLRGVEDNGNTAAQKPSILTYIIKILEADKRIQPFVVTGCERYIEHYVDFEYDDEGQKTPARIKFVGIIDREDQPNNGAQNRIADYKSGTPKGEEFKSVAELFDPKNVANHSDNYLQALFYSWVKSEEDSSKPISPALIFVKSNESLNNPVLKLNGTELNDVRGPILNEYIVGLKSLLAEIFDRNTPFTEGKNSTMEGNCKLCAFIKLCNKQ